MGGKTRERRFSESAWSTDVGFDEFRFPGRLSSASLEQGRRDTMYEKERQEPADDDPLVPGFFHREGRPPDYRGLKGEATV